MVETLDISVLDLSLPTLLLVVERFLSPVFEIYPLPFLPAFAAYLATSCSVNILILSFSLAISFLLLYLFHTPLNLIYRSNACLSLIYCIYYVISSNYLFYLYSKVIFYFMYPLKYFYIITEAL